MQAPRVLVIDDDVAIREAVAEAFDREGYQILFSSDGKQALKTINDSRPDVIVLDLKMPGMDGLEFLQRLDPRLPANCPVIVLTAYADAGTVKACHDAGVGCLRSPSVCENFGRQSGAPLSQLNQRPMNMTCGPRPWNLRCWSMGPQKNRWAPGLRRRRFGERGATALHRI